MLSSGDQKHFCEPTAETSATSATSAVTPSDCWTLQSCSRAYDAERLTLTGLELHAAPQCCNVHTDDGNPCECVFPKRESAQHLLEAQLSSFVCPLEGRTSSLLQTRQVRAKLASMWKQKRPSPTKQFCCVRVALVCIA